MLNVGSAYADLGDDERALEYMQRAAVRLRETGGRDGEATCLRDIGKIYERRGDVQRALECYRASLETTRELGARVFEAETLIRLGALRVRMGEADEGLADLRGALETAAELGARPQVYAAHEALYEVHQARGELAPALEHFRAYHAAFRDVFNAETNARIKSVLVRAEVQQAQREAEILRHKNDELTAAYDRVRQADEEKARLVARLRWSARRARTRSPASATAATWTRCWRWSGSAPSASAARSRWRCWTWTASNRSTTASATPRGTRCCGPSRVSCARTRAAWTSSHATAARSSA
jgi:tetratricopeptide (TPR) repeat protein